MRIPTIRGIIDRRLLINFRVDPKLLAKACPAPFRPQLVNGHGIAGICLIRLKSIRPKHFPSFLGLSSENAAHRIAVEWDTPEGIQTGVYIPRRDTSSILNTLAGGRIFPGVHHRAKFDVSETNTHFKVDMQSGDGVTKVEIDAQVTDQLGDDSIFANLEACSQFFEGGSLGYSPAYRRDQFDGLLLKTFSWKVIPLNVSHVYSTFFSDQEIFPTGSVTFDNALLMQGIEHEWSSWGVVANFGAIVPDLNFTLFMNDAFCKESRVNHMQGPGQSHLQSKRTVPSSCDSVCASHAISSANAGRVFS